MSLNAGKVLQIQVNLDPKEKILEYLRKYLENGSIIQNPKSKIQHKPLIIVTPNPEQAVLAESDPHFREIINQADVAIPDGIGIVWALKFEDGRQKTDKIKRISGADLMVDLVAMAEKNGVPITLIGGKNGLAVDAYECLKKKYPNLQGWGEDGPELKIMNHELRFMNHESTDNIDISIHNPTNVQSSDDYFRMLAHKIIKNRVGMVFVGLGAPKQEYFLENLKYQISNFKYNKPVIMMAVGGSFDFITGKVKRAPVRIQNAGFEWFWRLMQEPWRWKRQLTLVRFVYLVLKNQISRNFSS
jgi:N-acetylglucosaminyldiphosphoundecaprenol N-acetyl-beta-D-mannosaminyltransferase